MSAVGTVGAVRRTAAAEPATIRIEQPRRRRAVVIIKRVLYWLALLLAFVAAAGGLWFLYQKTQAADPLLRAAVETQLRGMRQLDSDWNVHVLRAKVGLDETYDTIVRPYQDIKAAQARLGALPGADDPKVKVQLEAMRTVFAQKADVVDEFKSHDSILRNSLRYLPTAAAEAHLALTPGSPAAGAGSPDPGPGALDTGLAAALSEILKYAVVTDDAGRDQATVAANRLAQLIEATPEGAPGKDAATVVLNHVRTILREKAIEERLLAGVAGVPTVAAIDRATAAYDARFATALEGAEFWRSVLFAYSAALLLLIAFIAWRLRQSYVEINRVNAGLEVRVRERTHELGQALSSLRESEAQLVQSEKMSSLGQMIAGVAHEINTPLAYVRSSLETVNDNLGEVANLVTQTGTLLTLMAAPEPEPERLSASFGELSTLIAGFNEHGVVAEMQKLATDGLYGIGQIGEIVTSLRNFSRLDRSKTTMFDLREGLDSTLAIARNVLRKHQVVKRYGQIPAIECSPSQLNQVFLNIITNAAQALPAKGGVITISAGIEEAMVRVDIADNGSGIASEHLEKIFDPFFTTKEIGKGTGLGLSIAYKIIQEHGGRISVKSTVGRGTVFSIRLPRHPGKSA